VEGTLDSPRLAAAPNSVAIRGDCDFAGFGGRRYGRYGCRRRMQGVPKLAIPRVRSRAAVVAHAKPGLYLPFDQRTGRNAARPPGVPNSAGLRLDCFNGLPCPPNPTFPFSRTGRNGANGAWNISMTTAAAMSRCLPDRSTEASTRLCRRAQSWRLDAGYGGSAPY
jgi:hypothetical protein